jgi:7-cyano-7-deazaguanine reductase
MKNVWVQYIGRTLTVNRPNLMPGKPVSEIDTFENRFPDRNYLIHFECPEFSCLCPMTGQPDFATIKISYIPDQLCVELKSLKFYMWHFRDHGIFHENVVNTITDHLNEKLSPRHIHVTGDFMVRGGIHTVVEASYGTATPNHSLNP